MPMSKFAQRPSISGWLTILTGILSLMTLAWIPFAIQHSIGPYNDSRRYHRAPGCTSDGAKDLSLTPCIYQPMAIVGKRMSSGRGGPTWYFSLKDAVKNVTVALLADGDAASGPRRNRLYDSVHLGDIVTTTEWNDRVTYVASKGNGSHTTTNPDHLWEEKGWSAVYPPAMLFVLFGGAYVATRRRSRSQMSARA